MHEPNPADRRLDSQICEDRGFHGPFARMEEFACVDGWEGFGICCTCGSSRYVPDQVEKQRTALPLTPEDPEITA